jgi:hypothetical protein
VRVPVERDSLVVGMALVPGFVSRNRSFALFEDPEVRRARRRAGTLRGIVRQLGGMYGPVEDLTVTQGVHGSDPCELRFRVPALRIERRASLTTLELACVRYLAGRAGLAGLHASDDDRAAIDAALRRLSAGLRLVELDGSHP